MTINGSAAQRATIHDVARLAGVSHQTVSRFLSRPEGLKPKTRAQVEAAVAELKYTPSPIARSMRTKKSNHVLIVLPNLSTYIPFEILKGASEQASASGYSVEVLVLEGKPEKAAERLVSLASSGQAEGIILLSQIPGLSDLPARQPWEAPVIVFGEYDQEMHSVGPLADATAVGEIVRLLVEQGHHRLAHIAGPREWPSAVNRLAEFERVVAEMGLPEPLIIQSDWSVRGGFDAAGQLPDPLSVTGIFAANDRIAFGVMSRLQERGLTAPHDYSIVGWDDEDYSSYLTPKLTTVHMDREFQGRQAFLSLLAAIEGEQSQPTPHQRVDHLIIRDSVASPPH